MTRQDPQIQHNRRFVLQNRADLDSADHGDLAGLGDDDHPHYQTDARADTWLAGKTTDDLTEGASNLYFSAAEESKLAGIEANAKDDQTAAEVTYDNSGSALVATDVDAALDELDSDVAAAETDILALDGRLTTAEGTITSQGAAIVSNDGDISALDTRVTDNEGDISTLQSTTTTNSANIGLNAATIANNHVITQAQQVTQDGRLTTNETDISDLQDDSIPRGTSFPVGPADKDKYYHETHNGLYIYISAINRWVSEVTYSIECGYYTSIPNNYGFLHLVRMSSSGYGWQWPYDVNIWAARFNVKTASSPAPVFNVLQFITSLFTVTITSPAVWNHWTSGATVDANVPAGVFMTYFIQNTATGGHHGQIDYKRSFPGT